jgi:Protein of unknown function (DUF1565)
MEDSMRWIHASGLALGVLAWATNASAADWFVEQGASGDGSSASPFGTIQQGLDAAHPGDVVIVAAGTYEEELRTQRDGAPASPIALRPAPGANVVVTASGRVLRVDRRLPTTSLWLSRNSSMRSIGITT